jgi:hypothetical protein
MLTKEERKLFSKKNINKIRREDFVEYIHMYEAQLDSLRNGYSPEVYQNPIVENIISELEALINDLNTYYYEKYHSKCGQTQNQLWMKLIVI